MPKISREDALAYHSREPKGKVEVVPTKPTATQADLSMAYTPGVAEPCREIAADPMARRLYAENLVSFFTGRAPNAGDACAVDELATKLAADSAYSMLDLVVDLTQMDSFRLRTVSD